MIYSMHEHIRGRGNPYTKSMCLLWREFLESELKHDHQLQLISLHTKELRELIQNEGRNHS
ncbi:hypothetical protein BsIDN1_37300 [Bacillus safensis]|uniref:Uncharacterized protein n=1 Tax=Bacillus safensis TaxID=561879 RepID=A0A5S9MBZ7_BACIA|nr:hypothetical protein BsIDN1_37300 [Bacillus safensis]